MKWDNGETQRETAERTVDEITALQGRIGLLEELVSQLAKDLLRLQQRGRRAY